ncbi:MAG: ribonuclease P protein component [Planctomycetes bacterium]|nr:ribonuclease P protein component [Planctomycetota bacterium]
MASYHFPHKEHLKDGSSFKKVMRGGTLLKERCLNLHYLALSEAPSHLGFVVGKKIGSAPERNQIKRMWKEAFRLERPHFSVPMDVVIRPLVGYKVQKLEEIRNLLRGLQK